MNRIQQLCVFSLMCIASVCCATEDIYNQSCCNEDATVQGVQGPCNVVFLSGEFLYWLPNQTGMTYAVSTSELGAILGSSSKAFKQKSSWAPGFRVGAGIELNDVPCEAGVYWTRFYHTYRSSCSGPFIIGTQLLSPSAPFTIGGSGVGGGNAQSKWNLKFDVVELDLAYRLFLTCNFLLRPYVGVVLGSIKQSQKIHYDNFLDTSTQAFLNAEIRQTNNFCGVGPKLGLSGLYTMDNGFGILGDMAGSFFYGRGKNPVRTTVLDDPIGFPIPESEVKYQQNCIVPLLQAKVGVNWQKVFMCNMVLDVALQYEVQYLWNTWRNQNSSIQNIYLSDVGYGNLMLQGLTLSFNVGF